MFVTSQKEALDPESLTYEHERFEALVREHQQMIHALCYRMTGSLTDAEDLAQEIFICAYQHLDGFRAEAGFSSWVYRIAVNLCLNRQKREQRLNRLHQVWAEQRETEQNSAPETAELHQVREALMKLNPKQRAAVVLTVYDGMNHAEAARALGCSETTVSWRLFAARRKLKQLLSRHRSAPIGTRQRVDAGGKR